MKVLCIGEALIDMICTDTGTSLDQGANFIAKPGGAPANVAAVIAVLGGEVELAAKVGNDPFGRKLVSVLQGFGVNTKWVMESPGHFTTMAFVSLMENGERDFVFNRGADDQLTKEETDAIGLDQVSIIHFGSATAFLPGPLQQAYQAMLQKAVKHKLIISFDPNYRHLLYKDCQALFISQCHDYMSVADFIKLSDEEAMLITGASSVTNAARALQQAYRAVFAITIGKEGALLRAGEHITAVPGIAVNAVDTTGAGDAFTGSVLFQLSVKTPEEIAGLNEKQWVEIIVKANKTGARTCEHFGAMEAFKRLEKNVI